MKFRTRKTIKNTYLALFKAYGSQGWWPLLSRRGKKGFDKFGYHQGDYSYPKTNAERVEIILGAILTQYKPFRY